MDPTYYPRLLLIMQDFSIWGRTRIQKYGFCIHQQYKEVKELGFYSDWKPYHFGPYSQNLADDLDAAIQDGYIRVIENPDSGTDFKRYRLVEKVHKAYLDLKDSHNYVAEIHGLLDNLEKLSLMGLLKQIYRDYPEYAVRSQIRDQVS